MPEANGGLSAQPGSEDKRSSRDGLALTGGSDPQGATCDNLTTSGTVLPASNGNCTSYIRNYEEETNWTYGDINAFAGHVISQTGSHDWYVEHQNCNSCNWTTDYTKWQIQAGYHYYYYTSDNNDDFNAHSSVQSNGTSNMHQHDVARIHDWNHRTAWTSFAAQSHSIDYLGVGKLYCTETPYEGTDPSNIYTSNYWDGPNNLPGC